VLRATGGGTGQTVTLVWRIIDHVCSKCGCNRSVDWLCRICREAPSLFAGCLYQTGPQTPGISYEVARPMSSMYAIESEESDIRLLLPPKFPEMRIWFRFPHPEFDRRFHRDCSGAGDWDSETCHTFTDAFAAVDALANEESTYFCNFMELPC
jgi:hypothetical protein